MMLLICGIIDMKEIRIRNIKSRSIFVFLNLYVFLLRSFIIQTTSKRLIIKSRGKRLNFEAIGNIMPINKLKGIATANA